MTTPRDTHGNPMGCVDEIRMVRTSLIECEQDDSHPDPDEGLEWVRTLLAALDALTAEQDYLTHGWAAESSGRHKDFKELCQERDKALDERDALKARVAELEAQVRGVLSNVRLADIYNTAGMEELAYRVGHWTRPPQTAQLDSAVKGGDMGKEAKTDA